MNCFKCIIFIYSNGNGIENGTNFQVLGMKLDNCDSEPMDMDLDD